MGDVLLAIHDGEEIALDLAHAVLCRDGASHLGDLRGPPQEQLFALGVIRVVARQDVDVQMVVADVSPRGRFKAGFGEGCAIEGNDVRQAVVGHGHIASQLGDGGEGAATLVDEHIDALGDRVAEEALALAVDVRASDPGVIAAAAMCFEKVSQACELGCGLILRIGLELYVDAVRKTRVELGKCGESGARFTLLAQDIERCGIEVLHGCGALEGGARGVDKGDRGTLGLKEAVDAPGHGGYRHEGEL